MNRQDSAKRSGPILSQIKEQPLVLIILLSVVLRMAVSFYMGNEVVELPGIFDQLSYHNLALRFLGGHGFTFGELWWPITRAGEPTAHWSFLYTFYLISIYAIFGPHPVFVRIIQSLIVGILHPYITYRIGAKAFNRNAGLIAAVITAFYIYFIYYDAALMTEPFYITFILFSLYFALRLGEDLDKKKNWVFGLALGVSIGLTVTLRQVFLLFIPFLFAWVWFVHFKRTRTFPISSTAVSFVVIALFILPITFYNYSRFHHFVLLNTNSGYAFFWGNNPIYGTKFIPILPTSTYRAMIPEELRHLDEAALDSELLRRGIQFVVQDPRRFILLSLSRIPSYFMFWYSASSGRLSNLSRIGSFGVMLPFMLYGLFLSIRRSKSFLELVLSPQGLLILFIIVYSGIHILTWTLIRYRLPVDAVLIMYAGLAINDIVQHLIVRFPVIQQLTKEGKQL